MDWQPTLRNDFIELRPLQQTDFAPLYTVARDPLIWEQHPCADRYRLEAFTRFFEDAMASGGSLVAIDLAQQKIIGSSRFNPLPQTHSIVEIGWSFLARAYWGGTYNRAVKDLMMAYAFQSVKGVLFYIGPENIRSQKAVVKIGGQLIGADQFPELEKGHVGDLMLMVWRKDWQAKQV